MYPLLTVDLNKIEANVKTVTRLCREYRLQVAGVTKVVRGEPAIASAMVAGGVTALADSHWENLRRLEGLGVERWMIRIPAIDEAEPLVQNAEGSLNSDADTLRALDRAARRLGRTHKVILMADLGDLREGFMDDSTLITTAHLVQDEMMSDADTIMEYLQNHLNGKVGEQYANPYGDGRIVIK